MPITIAYADVGCTCGYETDLTQPIYFGPRILNLNVAEVPAI